MEINAAVFKDFQVMSGELCFIGTRIPVRSLFGYVSGGDTVSEFLRDFPGVTAEQVETVLSASYEEVGKAIALSTAR